MQIERKALNALIRLFSQPRFRMKDFTLEEYKGQLLLGFTNMDERRMYLRIWTHNGYVNYSYARDNKIDAHYTSQCGVGEQYADN